jgi:hypothetical protein
MTHARAWTVALSLLVGCERAPDPAIGRAAAERARAHVTSGLGAVDRLTTGLARAMQGTSAPVGAAMGEVPRLRRALRDLHDDHTPLGRELTLYPLSFVVAVRPDGKAAASDRSGEPDVMAERDLGAAFPCVRAAAQGTAGTCAGQFGLTEGGDPAVVRRGRSRAGERRRAGGGRGGRDDDLRQHRQGRARRPRHGDHPRRRAALRRDPSRRAHLPRGHRQRRRRAVPRARAAGARDPRRHRRSRRARGRDLQLYRARRTSAVGRGRRHPPRASGEGAALLVFRAPVRQ